MVADHRAGPRSHQSIGGELLGNLRELFFEIGPTCLVIFGLCFAGLGAIKHSQSEEALAYDDHLRSVGVRVSSEVIEIESVRIAGGYRGRSTTFYSPTTVQRVNGMDYQTNLDVYELADRDYYEVGQRLEVMYDPANPQIAGIRSDELRSIFERGLATGDRFFYSGVVSLALGLPLLFVQLFQHYRKQWSTRHVRKVQKARRIARSRMRAKRRSASGN